MTRSTRIVGASVPAMTALMHERPELHPCFPMAAAFSDWVTWSA